MSITQAAYALCKAVVAGQTRRQLQALLTELGQSEPAPGGRRRGEFGYVAQRQQCQLLGYLLTDQERVRIASGPLPLSIPPLDTAEREMIASAHADLLGLNLRCAQHILPQFPNAALAIDPYSMHLPLTTPAIQNRALNLLPEELAADLAVKFRDHPDVRAILDLPAGAAPSLDSQQTLAATSQLAQRVSRSERSRGVSEIERVAFDAPRNDPMRYSMKYFSALLSLRQSLRNLNQMLFEAILLDRIPVLDEDSVFAIEGDHINIFGRECRLAFQPNGTLLTVEPGDIVLVKLTPIILSDGLVQTEELTFQTSREFGSRYTVLVRFLSDGLSPISSLVSAF